MPGRPLSITRRVGLAALMTAAPAMALAAPLRLWPFNQPKPTPGLDPDDVIWGRPDAPVTLIEYASLTCNHCARFHAEVYPGIERDFIKPGKVRFVLREFLTAPPALAAAAFLTARCEAPKPAVHAARIATLFKAQEAFFAAAEAGTARAFLLAQAKTFKISEKAFDACLQDPSAIERFQRVAEQAEDRFQIAATPTLILDGVKLTDPRDYTLEGLKARIEARLSATT